MSSPIFRFTKEVMDFFRENPDNKQFLYPGQDALKESGLEWSARGGGTQFVFKEDGAVEVSLIMTGDDDKNPETGQLDFKDVFLVRPNGQIEYQRLTQFNQKGDPEKWEQKRHLFAPPQHNPKVLERVKQFVAEKIVPGAPLFVGTYDATFREKYRSLQKEQKEPIQSLIAFLASLKPPVELDLKDPGSFYWVKRSGDKIELSLQTVAKISESKDIKGWVLDTFYLDANTLNMENYRREFHYRNAKGELKLNSDPATDAQKTAARNFLIGMSPFFKESNGALSTEVLEKKTRSAGKDETEKSEPSAPQLPVAQKVEGGKLENPLAGPGEVGNPLVPDLALMAVVTAERIEREADKSRGWWHRLTGGDPLDVAAERKLARGILDKLQAKLEKRIDPGLTLLRMMVDLPLNEEEKRVRDKMAKDFVIRQISNIAQRPDQEIRANLYLNLLRKDLQGSQNLPSTAHYLSHMLKETLPSDSKAREDAQLIFAELDPESKSRNWAMTLELGLPRLMEGLTEPESLAAFAVGGMAGAGVEMAAFKGLSYLPALAGGGRLATIARTTLGVGTGIVLGEAPAFAGSHALFNSIRHDPDKMLDWDRFTTECQQMSLLFGATRVAHGMTGMVVKSLQETERSWVQKIIFKDKGWNGWIRDKVNQTQFRRWLSDGGAQVPIGPMGRYSSLKPLPQFNWLGELTTGALHHSTGIYTMQEVMNLYPSLGLTLEGDLHRPNTFMDATLMYGHAWLGYHLANASTGGAMGSTIARLKMESHLVQSRRVSQEPGPDSQSRDSEPPPSSDRPSSEPPSSSGGGGGVDIPLRSLTRDPMLTMRDPGDPSQRFNDTNTTEPPPVSRYPAGVSEMESPTSRPRGEDTIQEMFPSAVTGRSEAPSLEALAGQGHSLDEISQAVRRRDISGTPQASTDREITQVSPPPDGVRDSSSETIIAEPEIIHARPEALPSTDEVVPFKSTAFREAKGKELNWWQQKLDGWFFNKHYSQLLVDVPKAERVQKSVFGLVERLRDSAMQWMAYGEVTELNLRAKLSQAGQEKESLNTEIGEKETKIREQKADIKKLQSDLRELQEKLEKAEANFNEEHKNFEKMGTEWQSALERVRTAEKNVNILEERVGNQQILMTDLRGIMNRLESHQSDGNTPVPSVRYVDIVAKLENILLRSAQSEKSIEQTLIDMTRDYDRAQADLARERSGHRAAADQLEAFEEVMRPIRENAEKHDQRLMSIRKKLQEVVPDEQIPEDDMSPVIDKLVERTQEAQGQFEEAKRARESLQSQFDEYKRQAEQDAEAAEEGRFTRDERIRQAQEELEKKNKEVSEVREQLQAAQAGSAAQTQLATDKAAEANRERLAKEEALRQKDQADAQVRSLTEELRKVREEVDQFAENQSREFERLNREVVRLEAELRSATKALDEKSKEVTRVGAERDTLQEKIEKLDKEINKLKLEVARYATDVSPEIFEQNRVQLEALHITGKNTEETPSSLDPTDPLRPVSIVVVRLTPEGKIDGVRGEALEFSLKPETAKPYKDPKKDNQVHLILAPEGILWHGPVDHLNGRQKTAVADLAKGMEQRVAQDPYTVASKWGEGMGPLARDLYHAFRDAQRNLNEDLSTRFMIHKQEGKHRAFHGSPDSQEYLGFRELLRDSSARIGLATINVQNPTEGGKVPFEQMTVTLHLGELADAEAVRQTFLHMGKMVAKRVSVNFVDGPQGGPVQPTGAQGPSGQSVPPRPILRSPKAAAAAKKAEGAKAAEPAKAESDPAPTFEERAGENFEGIELFSPEQIPPPPRAPRGLALDPSGTPEGTKKPSSIPPPPRYQISVREAKRGSIRELSPVETVTGESGKTGAPSFFERIFEFGELGAATYEGIDYPGKHGNEDMLGRFFTPDGSLVMVTLDGVGENHGKLAAQLVLRTFAENIPQGKSVEETSALATQAIARLVKKAIKKTFDLEIPESQTVKEFIKELARNGQYDLSKSIDRFAKEEDPQAAAGIIKINRPQKPGQPYTMQDYGAGDVQRLVQRQVDGEWKLVWRSVDQTPAQLDIASMSEMEFRERFGNISRDLALRIHPKANLILNSFSQTGPGRGLATIERGFATDLAEFVTLPNGEKALVLRTGDRILDWTDGGSENKGTTEQIVETASRHKAGQNPAKVYLNDNVRRQLALKKAREDIGQKYQSVEDLVKEQMASGQSEVNLRVMGHHVRATRDTGALELRVAEGDLLGETLRAPVILEDGKELWTNEKGAVYLHEFGGDPVDHLKSDNAGIQVLDFNPMDLKTVPQEAVTTVEQPAAAERVVDSAPSTRREIPRSPLPELGSAIQPGKSPPPPPPQGTARVKGSPVPPPPTSAKRPSPPVGRRNTPPEGLPSLPPPPPRSPTPKSSPEVKSAGSAGQAQAATVMMQSLTPHGKPFPLCANGDPNSPPVGLIQVIDSGWAVVRIGEGPDIMITSTFDSSSSARRQAARVLNKTNETMTLTSGEHKIRIGESTTTVKIIPDGSVFVSTETTTTHVKVKALPPPLPKPVPPIPLVDRRKSPPQSPQVSQVPPTVPDGARRRENAPPLQEAPRGPLPPPPIPPVSATEAGRASRRPIPPSMRQRPPALVPGPNGAARPAHPAGVQGMPPIPAAAKSPPKPKKTTGSPAAAIPSIAPSYEGEVLKVGTYAKLRIIIGKAHALGKPGFTSYTADSHRIDLTASGLRSADFGILERTGPNTFNLTNNQGKNTIFVTGGGLSSAIEIPPGQSREIKGGQTMEIGKLRLRVDVPVH